MAAQPACNADNMPLHFKQRRELTPTSESSPDSGAAAPSLTSAASASSVTSTQPPLILVPGSPPQTPRTAHDSHVLAATPSRLATLRQNNLARKREQMKTMKMPELSEHVESSSDSEVPAAVNGGPFSSQTRESKDSSSSSRAQSSASRAPLISVSSGDNDDNSKMDSGSSTSNGELVCRPPSPTDNLVTPSIPDSFLKQLGLSAAVPAPDKEQQQQEQDSGEQQQTPGVDQLPDKQLESRFNSLALAFKTDRLTLDKRLGIQERSRDVAEQNIDKELQGLRDATEVLHQLCGEDGGQEVISKIQQHLDILEMSVARVSSRAEVFGAVQQEKRMCLAMDVMITFTENIKRLRATELNEVSEAKKLLSDRDRLKTGFSLDTFSIGDRRSASVCAGLNNPRTTRRRSEVALPRFFGGTGSPSLHVSSSMEPRQRFQSATANVTVRNVVTSALRRASMDRQRNVTLQSSSLSFSPSSSANNSLDKPQDKDQLAKQNSQEEEAYRHGYEEGVKASLSRELTDLREQQTNINTSLEEVMDRVETLQQQDEEESEIDDLISKLKDIVVKVRQWMSNPNWQSASSTLRKVAAAIIFLAAVAVIVTTFSPLMSDNSTNRNHTQPAH